MSGWIKLNRSIQSHWIYNERRKFSKLEAWIDIIMQANFADNKTIIKGKIYEVKRGQSINSMETWSNRWGWDKSAVRRFIDLLQKDKMIDVKSDNITTHLTVCNYETYQGERNADETQTKRKRNANEFQTTPIEEGKEGEEIKEGKNKQKFDFKSALISYGFIPDLVNDWLVVRKNKDASNTKTALENFISQVEKSGVEKNEILKICISKDWKGFNTDWIKNMDIPKEKKPFVSNNPYLALCDSQPCLSDRLKKQQNEPEY
jgi:hypothetical protein